MQNSNIVWLSIVSLFLELDTDYSHLDSLKGDQSSAKVRCSKTKARPLPRIVPSGGPFVPIRPNPTLAKPTHSQLKDNHMLSCYRMKMFPSGCYCSLMLIVCHQSDDQILLEKIWIRWTYLFAGGLLSSGVRPRLASGDPGPAIIVHPAILLFYKFD